jgi:transcriptional regulator with XRE-family HTH domain
MNDFEKALKKSGKSIKDIPEESKRILSNFGNDIKELAKNTKKHYYNNYVYKGINSYYRESKGLTIKKLSELCNDVSIRSINNYESGKTDASVKKLMEISRVLDTTPDILLGIKTPPIKYLWKGRIVREDTDPFKLQDGEQGNYYLDEGLIVPSEDEKKQNINELGYEYLAVKLKEDSSLLHAPKGAMMIVDVSWRSLKLLDKGTLKVLLRVDGGYFPTEIHFGMDKDKKNKCFYKDIKGNLIYINKKEVDFKDTFVGIIKKVIIDY